MPAQIIHLKELQAFGEQFHVLQHLVFIGDIIDDPHIKFCSGNDPFDLTRIGYRVCALDSIFSLDLRNADGRQLVRIQKKGICKLQAGAVSNVV